MGLQESGGSEPRIKAEDRCGSILIGIVTLLQMPQDANDENIFHHLTFGPGTNSEEHSTLRKDISWPLM